MYKNLIGIWNYHEVLNQNRRFISDDPGYYLGEDSLKAFYNVYNYFKNNNYDVKILYDIEDLKKIDLLIFINYPKLNNTLVKNSLKMNIPKFLMMYEGPTIYPDMWKNEIYEQFDKIFTWHDDLIDNKKFFKINLPSYDLPIVINKEITIKNKFCITMGSNKKSSHKLDLYGKRLEAIEWFEDNHPNELDFFGYDWDKYIFRGNKLIRAFNRFPFLQKILAKNFKTYKGAYNGFKIPLFEKYKFSICFENAHSIPGWITEKIFHSMFAGCIPIYLGASNIKDHIPDNCYINFNNFKDFNDMYYYMKSISDNEFMKYLDNIQNFINSEKFHIFTHDYFTKTVTSEIFKVMNNSAK